MNKSKEDIKQLLKSLKILELAMYDFYIPASDRRKIKKELKEKKIFIFNIIKKIEKYEYQVILIERYINYKNYKDISIDLECSDRWIKKLHNNALDEFEKIYINLENI